MGQGFRGRRSDSAHPVVSSSFIPHRSSFRRPHPRPSPETGEGRILDSIGGVGRLLPKKGLTRSVAILAGGTAVSQLIAVAVAPVYTRLYTPEDFGTVGVYCDDPRPGGDHRLWPVRDGDSLAPQGPVGTGRALAVSRGVGGRGGVDCRRPVAIRRLDGRPDANRTTATLSMAHADQLGWGWHVQGVSYWAVRRKAYRSLAQTKVNQRVFGAGVTIGVGAVHSGPLGLLLGTIVGETAGILTLGREVRGQGRRSLSRPSLLRLGHVASTYRQFPVYSAGGVPESGCIVNPTDTAFGPLRTPSHRVLRPGPADHANPC